jgi:hypothetical protein
MEHQLMSTVDWSWKLAEAAERIRTRYAHIGSKTGAPFLAIVYPPEAQAAVFKEWHVQLDGLKPEFDVRSIDLLQVTHRVVAGLGAPNVVEALRHPMPGSDPLADLNTMWAKAIVEGVRQAFAQAGSGAGKPAVSLERCASLHPVMGPSDMMRALWGGDSKILEGPVIVLIPGSVVGPRTYEFLDIGTEFMYRGDLI